MTRPAHSTSGATPPASPEEESLAWKSRHGQAYDEPVFHYLLDIERRRSALTGCPLVLVLVELHPPSPGEIDLARADRLFSILTECVRETDIVGWHRRGRVAGIVITELGDRGITAVCDLLHGRVGAALDRSRARLVGYRLHVRIDRRPRPIGQVPAAADANVGRA
ncbi:MAG TPA: hypothetical protein VLU24_06755 [Mycobacterium sp.]|nr:hypothetical protein [Mycobacterium sp.]